MQQKGPGNIGRLRISTRRGMREGGAVVCVDTMREEVRFFRFRMVSFDFGEVPILACAPGYVNPSALPIFPVVVWIFLLGIFDS